MILFFTLCGNSTKIFKQSGKSNKMREANQNSPWCKVQETMKTEGPQLERCCSCSSLHATGCCQSIGVGRRCVCLCAVTNLHLAPAPPHTFIAALDLEMNSPFVCSLTLKNFLCIHRWALTVMQEAWVLVLMVHITSAEWSPRICLLRPSTTALLVLPPHSL